METTSKPITASLIDHPAITDDELSAFVGPNADYYLKKWRSIQAGTGSGLNWAAGFMSGLWLPYRKMYKVAAIFYGIILVEILAEDIVFVGLLSQPAPPRYLSRIVIAIACVICGIYGNRWYLSHARKKITETRRDIVGSEAQLTVIAERGGVNMLAPFGFGLSLFLAGALGLTALYYLVYPSPTDAWGTHLQFNENDHLYIGGTATEQDAQAIAEILEERHYFGHSLGAVVRVYGSPHEYEIYFFVLDGAWDDQEYVDSLADIRSAFSTALQSPIVIHLCDSAFNVRKTYPTGE